MRLTTTALLAAPLLAAGGAGWAAPSPWNSLPFTLAGEAATFHVENLPVVGSESEVDIGQPVLVRQTIAERTAYTLDRVTTGQSGKALVTVPAGTYTVMGRGADGRFLEPLQGGLVAPLFGEMKWIGVWLPADQATTPMVYYRSVSAPGTAMALPSPGLQMKVDHTARPAGLRQELVYGGVAKGVVSILYREFNNDYARPAFSQQLTYDLADGQEIGFRGARFKVLKATNTSIRYVVLKPLDGDQ